MTTIENLRAQFEHETKTTRRHLERLPADQLDWRPHQKSFSLRALASHIVDCVGWAESIFGSDGVDLDPAALPTYTAASVDDLLATFDAKVASGSRMLAAVADADVDRPWRLALKGRLLFERPKGDVLQDFTLSHLIHHRGQLSVYLRLLDVPVPGSYGPTADER
jgi:uncharacterized damage-inducible protein DinB